MSDEIEPQTADPMVAALLRERAAYLQRGLPDRVAQVDAQLSARGHVPQPAESSGGPEADGKPRGRRTRQRHTTG